MTVYVGTSGWHYKHWANGFYPKGVGQSKWLGYYAERFQTVEVNNAFYRLPETSTFDKWRAELPDGFVVAVKASRYLTHVRRLNDPAEPVHRLMDRASHLMEKLGPVLLQLPPNLKLDVDHLEATLKAFSSNFRVAVEARHDSWFVDEVRALLERNGAAWCLADGGPVRPPLWATTDWGYVRFHAGTGSPEGCYTRSPLETWARRLGNLWGPKADVFTYFNNDGHCCAVHDSRLFAAALERVGMGASPVPPRDEARTC